jgi:Domain of unknown function (DUF4347)
MAALWRRGQWRSMSRMATGVPDTSATGGSAPGAANAARPTRTPAGGRAMPMIMALEARLMFDASVAATAVAADVADVAVRDSSHDAAIDARPTAVATASATESSADTSSAQASTATRHDIVFVDNHVSNAQEIIQNLPAGTEVVLLDASTDGWAQMAAYLNGRHDIDSISLISHGAEGAVQAGSVWLTADTLASHADQLRAIGAALSEQGDLLLYGCKVAEGSAGQQLLNQIATLTSADVAGSTDNTGAAALGGDWTLERQTGAIEAPSLAGALGAYDTLLAAPSYENFDAVILTDDGAIRKYLLPGEDMTIDGWTLGMRNVSGNADSNSRLVVTNQQVDTVLADGAQDKALIMQGDTTTYAAVLKSASGDEFNLHSITVEDFFSGNTQYQLVGYRDGVQVSGATLNFTMASYGTTTNGQVVSVTGTAWQSVDEVRIVYQNGQGGVSLAIDDINVSAGVPPNAVPVITNLGGDSITYTEGDGTVKLDASQNALVTDTDSTDFDGGNLTVAIVTNNATLQDQLTIVNQGTGAGEIGVSGSNVTYGGTTIGTFSGGTLGSSLVITFNVNATPDAVQALVRNIAFKNDSDDPIGLDRIVQFTLNDGDSASNSAYHNVTVNMRPVNDEPTLMAAATSPTYVEGGAAVTMFSNASVSTVESGQSFIWMQIQVSNVADGASEVLGIDGTNVALFNGNSVTTSTLGLSVTVSVSGGTATVTLNKSSGISPANVQTLINTLSYRDTSDAPTAGNRTVALAQLRDNGGTSNGGTDTALPYRFGTVTVAAVNDAPIVTTSGGSADFTSGDNTASTAIVVDSGLTISDVDSTTLASATVAITGNFRSAEDELLFTNSNNTLYGNISANYNAATGEMTLTSAGNTATVAQWQAALRSVRYTNSAVSPDPSDRTISFVVNDGTLNSVTSTRLVDVTATDQTPIISNSGGSSLFTEGQGQTQVDPGLTVSDLDNATLASATVQITGNFRSGEDLLQFTNTNSSIYGNIVGNYNAGTGEMSLTSAGASATVAQWQAALRDVHYNNLSGTPDTSTRTVAFTISDGVKTSAAGTRTLTVVSTDIPPVLSTSGGSATFTEANQVSSTPTVVDSGLTLSDADSPTLASATVAITGNFQAGADVLDFINTANSLYGNIISSYDASTGVLSLSSAGATATAGQWQAALRAVSYSNTSDTPTAAARTVSFTISDGAVSSSTVTRTVNVVPVDDTPLLAGGTGSPVFQELDGQPASPVAIAPGLTLTDSDSPTLVSATVAITGNLQSAEDLLAFTNADATQFGNISASYNAATGVLTLSSAGGTATAAQWQAALRSVTYSNSAEAPNTASRTVSITVNDGSTDSNTVSRTLAVVSTNDTPVNQTPVAVQHVFQDGSLVFSSAQGNAISISDADVGNGLVQVTLTVTNGSLSLSGTTGLNFAVGTGTGDATMTFTGSVANINAALQGLSFAPSAGYNGAATLQITTDDLGNSGGAAASDTDTITLSVDAQFPVITGVNTAIADGGYKVGDVITTTITFDQAVIVDASGGTPSLLLETGAIDRQAVYVSGSGSNTLTFSYVVQAGDTTARLDYASSAALALNGGSIRSATQFDAVLALPTPGGGDSLAAQHAIQIDGVAPTDRCAVAGRWHLRGRPDAGHHRQLQ